jgi:uncharacterized membrane protein YoaK (UPF0700 family)
LPRRYRAGIEEQGLPAGFAVIRHSVEERFFAIALSTLAGFVDAIGFLDLGGYFVSFMSGNTTRLGAELVHEPAGVVLPLAIIAIFVSGVVAGSLIGQALPGRRRRSTILAFVACLLLAAAVLGQYGASLPALSLVAFAMGAKNTVFERDGEVTIGLTYMTGALVKVGQRIASALTGGDRTAWVWYAALWAGLAAGAGLGAACYLALGLGALWLAALAAMVFALLASLHRTVAGLH